MANKNSNQPETVSVGSVYERKSDGERVVAFHLEAGGIVRFSPQGIGSGREDRMPSHEFLDQYDRVDDAQVQKDAQKADEAAGIPRAVDEKPVERRRG